VAADILKKNVFAERAREKKRTAKWAGSKKCLSWFEFHLRYSVHVCRALRVVRLTDFLRPNEIFFGPSQRVSPMFSSPPQLGYENEIQSFFCFGDPWMPFVIIGYSCGF